MKSILSSDNNDAKVVDKSSVFCMEDMETMKMSKVVDGVELLRKHSILRLKICNSTVTRLRSLKVQSWQWCLVFPGVKGIFMLLKK